MLRTSRLLFLWVNFVSEFEFLDGALAQNTSSYRQQAVSRKSLLKHLGQVTQFICCCGSSSLLLYNNGTLGRLQQRRVELRCQFYISNIRRCFDRNQGLSNQWFGFPTLDFPQTIKYLLRAFAGVSNSHLNFVSVRSLYLCAVIREFCFGERAQRMRVFICSR